VVRSGKLLCVKEYGIFGKGTTFGLTYNLGLVCRVQVNGFCNIREKRIILSLALDDDYFLKDLL
jgi:hypothetical protein